MPKLAIAIGASLLTGFAAAAFFVGGSEPAERAGERKYIDFDNDAGVAERLRALESAVSAERQARQLLEDELLALYDALDALENPDEADDPIQVSTDVRDQRNEFRARFGGSRRYDPEQRLADLTEAGFSVSRADWIMQRESELRMEAMQARYDAMRQGETPSRALNPDNLLRAEVGDAEYEMFLQADNRPTSVNVGRVFDSSPALTAGLQSGDQITHYDGERVFSTFDLTRQTMDGNAGENVVVNIVRNGVPMQVVLPRGPLGINTLRGR
ncbi:MAG: PDZ domain-containing protein [Gammaproteobacteria bacterium]|nr:PDZ domain-containing protein [Gammaproteobacteria bacterium]